MLLLTLCNILFIVVSVQGTPAPQRDSSDAGIVVPTIPTDTSSSSPGSSSGAVDDSQTTTSSNYRQRVGSQDSTSSGGYSSGVFPQGRRQPGSGSQYPGSNARYPSSNVQNSGSQRYSYQPTSNTQDRSAQTSYRQADSTTSSSNNVIVRSSQTCRIEQPAADKGVDKIGSSCTSFDAPGTYTAIADCPMGMSEAGDYSKDAYPTSNGVQCCAPKSCTPPSTLADGSSIDPTAYVGKCMNKHKGANCAYYKGSYVENLCPGPFTIQCCVIPKDTLPSGV